MIHSNHFISIYIGGEQLDIASQNALNMRMNNILFDAATLITTQAEYSFSFELPATPTNNRIFDYADNFAKNGKFGQRFLCEVYADDVMIFQGNLTLRGYNGETKMYSCNLVSVKIYNIDDIFGDTTMDKVDWYVPFNGAGTINEVNANITSKVYFPFVAYGVFEKEPFFSDEVADDYTDARELDKWCRFYPETFVPSVNLVETVRRLFEHKGYTLHGNIFSDNILNNIFLSTSLASDQNPLYNLAHPKMGTVDLSIQWTNGNISGNTVSNKELGIIQSLNYPYYRVYNINTSGGGQTPTSNFEGEYFNFGEIEQFNVFSGNVTENTDSYIFDSGEQCIVVPADGMYKIDLEVDARLKDYNGNIVQGTQQYVDSSSNIAQQLVNIPYRLSDNTPFEIQLVRNVLNSQDGATIELIRGKHNKEYYKGLPYVNGVEQQYREWDCCYPHEWRNPRYFRNPTTSDAPTAYTNYQMRDTDTTTSYTPRSMSAGNRAGKRTPPPGVMTYIYKDGEPMAYDPVVSPYFICGFSTMGEGEYSILKDGRSWYAGDTTDNMTCYNSQGYWRLSNENGSTHTENSSLNANTYRNAPNNYVRIEGNRLTGRISCCVWLNKNDVLTLNMVHRYYNQQNAGDKNEYYTSLNANLKMSAFTPKNKSYIDQNSLGYTTPSEFDYDLRVSNFFNEETQMSSFVSNFIRSFNLDYRCEGKDVYINTQAVKVTNKETYPVNIDNRVSTAKAQAGIIEYPSAMAVKWAVDTQEWGFWTSVPIEWRNDRDWAEHGDYGYTDIQLDPYGLEPQEVSNDWSYNWFDIFTLYYYDNQGNVDRTVPLRLPVIGEYQYMAPGANYGESMNNDGLSLRQRLWFRQPVSTETVTLTSGENVYLSLPTDVYEGIAMSYKTDTDSLLRYFNIRPSLSSNYITVNVYLDPDEYLMLKNGAMVRFDDDLYFLVDITGYDPTNNNTTELRLMKKS